MSNISLKDNELLENLKKECDMLDISYTKNATVNSLTKKIRAFKEASAEGVLEVSNVPTSSQTEEQKKAQMMQDAKKLVRVEITCNDPKIRVRGQIFRSVSNKYVSLRKVIPLEVPTHVPQLILNNLKESKFLTFITKRTAHGETSVPKEVATYNIRELDPLTPEQFKRIQIRQQADQAIGDD
jgi:hypothetical protein